MIPEALEEQLQQLEAAGELDRVKAIYITSYYSNPSTATLSASRRPQVVELAQRYSRRHPIYVIDDAAYRDLRYEGTRRPVCAHSIPSGETVIMAQTFSKCFSPGIRVGYGILPEQLVEPVLSQKGNIDFGAPNFSQHLIWKVLERGVLRRTLSHACAPATRQNFRPCSAQPTNIWRASREFRGVEPTGGLYVWLKLPEHLAAGPSGPFLDASVAAGVLYVPGEYCFPSEGVPVRKNTIRLSFGVQTEAGIRRGIAALGQAIRDVTRRNH